MGVGPSVELHGLCLNQSRKGLSEHKGGGGGGGGGGLLWTSNEEKAQGSKTGGLVSILLCNQQCSGPRLGLIPLCANSFLFRRRRPCSARAQLAQHRG